MRVPYGDLTGEPADAEVEEVVLAASKALVDRVCREDEIYSACGYLPRMADSIGEIYLGLDDGPAYQDVAPGPNAVLMAVDEQQAFAVAYGAGRAQIRGHIATYKAGFQRDYAKVDLSGDYLTPVLAQVCRHWFGIPDEPPTPFGQPRAPTAGFHVLEGGWSWVPMPRQPHCPGDFMSPSRSIFYPDPGSEVRRHGAAHGQALRAAVRDLFAETKAKDAEPTAPLSQKMFRQIDDPDDLARVVVGAMMGFLPPADGNLRGTLYDWLEDKTLWRVQRALPPAPAQPTYQWAADGAARSLHPGDAEAAGAGRGLADGEEDGRARAADRARRGEDPRRHRLGDGRARREERAVRLSGVRRRSAGGEPSDPCLSRLPVRHGHDDRDARGLAGGGPDPGAAGAADRHDQLGLRPSASVSRSASPTCQLMSIAASDGMASAIRSAAPCRSPAASASSASYRRVTAISCGASRDAAAA